VRLPDIAGFRRFRRCLPLRVILSTSLPGLKGRPHIMPVRTLIVD
jgi:hypothetical protein